MSIAQEEQPTQLSLLDVARSMPENPLWNAETSELTYSYPIPTEESVVNTSHALAQDIPETERVQVGPFSTLPSPESHIGPWKSAIDFAVEDGTPVLAAQDGMIFAIVDKNNQSGATEEFKDNLNYVAIKHSDGEYTEYAHLAQDSVSDLGLKVGSYVKQGQKIGDTGMTGWTDRPHLHFLAFTLLGSEAEELPPGLRFRGLVPKFE